MNQKTAKQIRRAAGYVPGTPAEYEKPVLRRLAEMPKYETYEGTVRTWDPKTRKYISNKVTKIRYASEGKTPLRPIWNLRTVMDDPAYPEGHSVHIPATDLIPITAPIRLKKGSPKAIYRMLKKFEKGVGLDRLYDELAEGVKA